MSRGDHRQAIFRDETDCHRFMKCLDEVCDKTGWRIHAFVLLKNHYHMLAETPEGNLVDGMKWFQGAYAQRFNARHKQHGHVFQGRYRALLVEPEADMYFATVSTYIHLNPARALVIHPGEEPLKRYQWSSYPLYLREKSKRAEWMVTDRVLGSVGIEKDNRRGRKQYERYLEGRALDLQTRAGRKSQNKEWEGLRRGWYLGSEKFRDKLQEHLEGVLSKHQRDSYDGEAVRQHDEADAEELLIKGMLALGLTEEDLAVLPKSEKRKAVLAWGIRKHTTMGSRWISDRLNMGHIANVTNYVRAMDQAKDQNVLRFRRQLAQILKT